MSFRAHQVLFVEKRDRDGKPLFASQADLARSIMDHDAFKPRAEATVRAFLNQALKPANDRYSRPISPNLRDAIWQAVRVKSKPEELEKNLRDLGSALLELKDASKFEHPSDSKEDWEELLKTARNARHHFIITPTPAETMKDQVADELSRIMVQKLHETMQTWKPGDAVDLLYEFYIAKENAAEDMLDQTVDLLSAMCGSKSEAQRIMINAENSGVLSVYYAKVLGFIPPTVVFEPRSIGSRSGYVFFYHPKGPKGDQSGMTVSVARMDDGSLARWDASVYWPLVRAKQGSQVAGFEVTPISYQQMMEMRSSSHAATHSKSHRNAPRSETPVRREISHARTAARSA